MSVVVHSLIGGAWVTGSEGTLTDTNPARPDEVVATGGRAGASEMATGVRIARIAANDWARLPMSERGAYLTRAAEIIETNADAWGEELTREEGKTLAEGIGEVRRAAQILRYYGNAADRESGTVYSSPRSGEQILVTRKPLGVVGVVTPFNFPIAIPAWKIAPALVYGNTVVWKPAAAVPLLAFRLAQALTEAGLPDGVLNMILADSAAGEALVDHPDLDAVTFTGSTGVGRRIAGSAAARGVPAQAEMGGKNAAIVLADADLELAVEQVMLGAFRSTGQKCTATSRLVLHESIAEEFLARLTVEVEELRVGDPLDPDVTTGPVVSAYAQQTIIEGIDRAVGGGARVVASAEAPESGHYVRPTVLELSASTELWFEELFGPVLAVQRAATTADAFRLANEGEFGLSAALFTQDLTSALAGIDDLDVGILHVNSESAGADPHVPFGGAKKSGYGPKEQGDAAREFFTHTTTVYLRGGRA
ncbi:aldehyde dehydrogenase [Rhodococcus erythropolis R138]|uniref:aldehyde dehydrogenase family protein n=1 Tax=Rhodococcus erythropolis TaxID=1833 RepID=UPI00049253F4|nr:aldehyde dehydrogenase family protein [Rhodococcus erythropolis]ALU68675.1 aldehyde dehydrogenase [Rhodococcus erythropolis R138]